MALVEFEVPVIVQDGQPVPVCPPAALDSDDTEGLQYEDENGEASILYLPLVDISRKRRHTAGITFSA